MWGNPTLFHCGKSMEKNIEKRQISTQPLDKIFLHRIKSIEKNIEKR